MGEPNKAAQILALPSAHLERLLRRGLIEDFRHMEALEPLTVRHLSTRDESYKLRYLDGSHLPAPWKAADCETFTSLRVLQPSTVVVDVAKDGRDLSQDGDWQERVRGLNAAHGLRGSDVPE